MINEFSYQGEWFLPSNPSVKIPGTLKFDAKSDGELELSGVFEEERFETRETQFILGIAKTGKYITLYNCWEYSRTRTSQSMYSNYNVFYIVIGGHFSTLEDFRFNGVSARFKNIDKWVRQYGFKLEHDFPKHEMKVEYKKPKDITFKLSNDLLAKFSFNSYLPISPYTEELNIRQAVFFELEPSTHLSFSEILGKLLLFQNFLTLGTFESAYPTSIHLTTNRNTDKESTCELIYKPGFDYTIPNKYRPTFLFYYSDFDSAIEPILQKWYSVADKLEPVTSLLLESFYSREKSKVNGFLSMVQALETYHRRFKNYHEFDVEEFKQWSDALVGSVDEKFREMLKGKLQHANEPSLRKRLKELITNLSSNTLKKMYTSEGRFINATVNSRNYYTHYSEESAKSALGGADLSYQRQKLRVLLIGTILLEIGINKEKINEILDRGENWFFNHLIKK